MKQPSHKDSKFVIWYGILYGVLSEIFIWQIIIVLYLAQSITLTLVSNGGAFTFVDIDQAIKLVYHTLVDSMSKNTMSDFSHVSN